MSFVNMARNALRRRSIVYVTYFLILAALAIGVRDVPNQLDPYRTTLAEIARATNLGDVESFAKAASDIAAGGRVLPEHDWVLKYWPPGFVLLEAGVTRLFGLEAPILFVLQILAALAWAAFSTLFFDLLRERVNSSLAFAAPLLLFLLPMPRLFLLQPVGLGFGETFAIAFFLIALLYAIRGVKESDLRTAGKAGVFLALAAYFRSQFEIFLLALTGWAVLLAFSERKFAWLRPREGKPVARILIAVLVVAHVTTLPWRIYHWVNQGSPKWVQTDTEAFKNQVLSRESLNKVGDGFVVEGGGNLACRIDPATCGRVAEAKALTLRTLLHHPVEWYRLKYSVFWPYWMSSHFNIWNISNPPLKRDFVWNGLYFFSILIAAAALFSMRVRHEREWPVLLWSHLAVASANVLIFTFQQFEVRYFYFPKIYGTVFAILSLAIFIGNNPRLGALGNPDRT
jgi:hypothetical protein